MEVKMNQITLTVNETLDRGLTEGFKDLSNELSELTKILRENLIPENKNLQSQSPGRIQASDHP